MEWYLDTANLNRIEKAVRVYPLEGVTTNPTILKKEGSIDYFAHLEQLRSLCRGKKLHVQLGAAQAGGMVTEAKELFDRLGTDIYLKIPAHEEGIRAMAMLKKQGAFITATAVGDALQGMMALAAGADYLAPYCNRMGRYGVNFEEVLEALRTVIDRDGYSAKILAASFRDTAQVRRAILAGAHGVTLAPDLMDSIFDLPLLKDAAEAFEKDYRAVTQRG